LCLVVAFDAGGVAAITALVSQAPAADRIILGFMTTLSGPNAIVGTEILAGRAGGAGTANVLA